MLSADAALLKRLRPGYYLLVALAMLQFSLSIPLGVATFGTYFSMGGLTKTLIPAWSLFPLVWAAGVGIVLTKRRINHPLRAMRSMLYRNRAWLGRCSFFAIIIIFVARSVTSYKTSIPDMVPYWADPYLVAADHALFGADPWRLTHAIIGPLGTKLIDDAYTLWFMMMMLCVGWFCFSRNPKLQLRGLLTTILVWGGLSNLAATMFASVGPCYYEHFYKDRRFVPMMDQLQLINAEYPLSALRAMAYLLKSFGQDKFGTGISAMPSLHVSVAMMCFLACCSYTRSLWLKIASGLFAATILVGSVHLGWHYAVDGLVGIAAVTLFWWGTGRFVDWLDQRHRAQKSDFAQAVAAG